jgi:hypothetical protein
MTPMQTTVSARVALLIVLLGACAKQATLTEIRAARYDMEQAAAFASARAAVAAKRPIAEQDAEAGVLVTDWETITVSGAGRATYRARFHVALVGPRPWRIDVMGEVAERPGESPDWLGLYRDRLHREIHEQLVRTPR